MSKTKTITIPSSWNEVTVLQYQKIQMLDVTKYESNLTYMTEVIAILANTSKDYIGGVNVNNLVTLINEMEWLNEPIKEDKKEEVLIGDDKYHWKGSFNSLTVGEMISIEQVIDIEELSYVMAMDVILAVLLRKKLENGELEDFDPKIFNDRRELFSTLKITDVYGMVLFFSSGEDSYTSNIKVCSTKGKMEKMNLLKKSWNWIKRLKRLVFRQDGNGSV
jgi:hypothetical protein